MPLIYPLAFIAVSLVVLFIIARYLDTPSDGK